MNPRVASGLWSQEKLMMAQLKVGYLPHFSLAREDKETTKREDSFRFSNQTWQNKPWWYHVAWILTAARCFWCTIAFSQWSCSPGSRSDGNVLTSHHGKQYRRFYRFLWRGLVLSRPLKVYKAIILMFGDRVSLYLTQYVERKHAEDNRNDYPLVVAMVPDKCAWMT